MSDKKLARRKAIIRRRIFLTCCTVVLICAIAVISFTVNLIFKAVKENNPSSETPSSSQGQSSEDKTPRKIASATVVNTGDIMIHSTVLDGAKVAGGGYDFSALFSKVKPNFQAADLAVANLEVTFGGTESGKYSGYPAFNSPDSLADTIKESGIGLLLTSNNHCYDTGLFGLKRTVQVLKQKGIPYTGTRETTDEPAYIIKKVNGIKIGMVCYTYETASQIEGRKAINGGVIAAEAGDLINSFNYDKIDAFYSDAQQKIASMKKEGADCIVFYMHWGNEYQLTPNTWQKTIAQQLCNFGVDVIVGSHPHVIQPVSLIHSEDSQRTTVCLYSMGNSISNQRQELMDSCPTGHTEDGVLFSYTFDKYSDGSVILSAVDIVPTWVDKYRGGSGYLYTMYPLETASAGASLGLTGAAATKSAASFERTKAIVAAGLTEVQTALGCPVRFGS